MSIHFGGWPAKAPSKADQVTSNLGRPSYRLMWHGLSTGPRWRITTHRLTFPPNVGRSGDLVVLHIFRPQGAKTCVYQRSRQTCPQREVGRLAHNVLSYQIFWKRFLCHDGSC